MFLTAGCGSSAPPAPPYPHQSVLSVVAELKLFLVQDPYRFAAGRDAEGQNIYRVTLARLQNLEQIVGAEYQDIIAFARGQTRERLGEYRSAAEDFAKVAEAGTSLSEEARIALQWNRALTEITAEPASPGSLDQYLNLLDSRRARLIQLRESQPAFPYDALISREIENVQQRKALMLFTNRYVFPRGSELALEEGQKLVAENRESQRLGEHLLMLGRFFEETAEDYALLNPPSGTEFDPARWNQWVDQARSAYAEVARADGDPAKPEGQAKLRALDAFAQRILESAR